MKAGTLFITLLFALTGHLSASNSSYIPPIVSFVTLKTMYQQGFYQRVIDDGQSYLTTHPNNVDVRLYVALAYYQIKDYPHAKQNFQLVLNQFPDYKDAQRGLARVNKAQESQVTLPPVVHPTAATLSSLQELYQKRRYQQVIDEGQQHLKKNPDNVDVRLYVALAYDQLKDYSSAKQNFQLILDQFPDYKGAQRGLARVNKAQESQIPPLFEAHSMVAASSTLKALYQKGHYQQVIDEGQQHLKKNPDNVDVRLYVALAYYQIKDYSKARTNFQSILEQHPNYTDARLGLARAKKAQAYKQAPSAVKVTKKIDKTDSIKPLRDRPHFELGLANVLASVNRPEQYWRWSTVSLYRKNQYGSFGVLMNNASRLSHNGSQVYLNLQPKLNEKIWFDLGYGNSNMPFLFPNTTLGSEIYARLNSSVIVSAGESYKKIEATYFNTITASFEKYFGNYTVQFRPYHFIPKAGPKSTLYQVRARKYTNNPDQYVSVLFAKGTSPDLFDLLTVTFFNVKELIAMVEAQQPLNENFALKCGAGYESQQFPNGFVRRLLYLNLGMKVLF